MKAARKTKAIAVIFIPHPVVLPFDQMLQKSEDRRKQHGEVLIGIPSRHAPLQQQFQSTPRNRITIPWRAEGTVLS